MATNTTKSMTEVSDNVKAEIVESLKRAQEKFKGEKQVTVSVPKNLQRAVGQTLFLSINGVSIVLPVDGSKHKVPESFKNHLDQYIANLQL